MKRVYTIVKTHLVIILLVTMTIIFIATQPRIAVYLPWHYSQFQDQFLTQILQSQTVDPKVYWEFREFYSLGNFTFNPDIITFGENQRVITLPNDQNMLLTYISPRLQSTDYQVKINPSGVMDQIVAGILLPFDQKYAQNQLVFSDNSTRLWKTADHAYVLVFVRSINEMKNVSGFFDYEGSDKQLLKNSLWLNETTFR